jgi:hypothetical protein
MTYQTDRDRRRHHHHHIYIYIYIYMDRHQLVLMGTKLAIKEIALALSLKSKS